MKRKIAAIGLTAVLGAAAIGAMAGCSEATENEKTVINVSGSSSVSPLMLVLEQAYEALHSDVDIKVNTSDSGTGIKDAQTGKNDFGMASRELKSTETGVVSQQIATDGVAIIVNRAVSEPESVTSEQIYALYANGTAIGEITNAIARESGSGTRDAFDELIEDGNENKLKALTAFSSVVSTQTGTGAVITAIESNTKTLGYISMGSLGSSDAIKALRFNGVEATVANVENGTYELSRPFNIVYREGQLSEAAQAFVEFIMGEEGQAIVEREGYISVS